MVTTATRVRVRAKRLLGKWRPMRLSLQYARGLSSGQPLWVAPGHFYSPIPSLRDLSRFAGVIWGPMPPAPAGINMGDERQRALLDSFSAQRAAQTMYTDPQPSSSRPQRYSPLNDFFPIADAVCLALMLTHEPPRRVIEVGSGYSSAVMLDVREQLLDHPVDFTFIDPYPERLRSLLRPDDHAEIIAEQVQRVPLDRFDALTAGDILFIDSSHVAKTGSDVNFLFFEILPRLKPGVRVHIHDIVYPFEYPREWSLQGRAWNEAYLLRAFLQFNSAYRIEMFPSYLTYLHPDWLDQRVPCWRDHVGCSIWLRRAKQATASE
jgi:predicted O-methyltransferase YrrM